MQASFVKLFHIEIALLLFSLPMAAIYHSIHLAIIFPSCCYIVLFFFCSFFYFLQHVTAGGCKNMTKCPREISEIEAVMAGAPWPIDKTSIYLENGGKQV